MEVKRFGRSRQEKRPSAARRELAEVQGGTKDVKKGGGQRELLLCNSAGSPDEIDEARRSRFLSRLELSQRSGEPHRGRSKRLRRVRHLPPLPRLNSSESTWL